MSENIQKVKLGDYILQVRGVSYKPTDVCAELTDDSVVLLRANNIQNGKINFDDVIYVAKNKVKPQQFLRKGDILICTSSGSKDLVGKAAVADKDYDCITFGAFCKVIRAVNINAEFLAHYFQSDNYKHDIMMYSQGVNINNLRAEHFDNLNICLPIEKREQEDIANKFDKVASLIDKRKRQLKKLDELIKSRFIEMFGDPKKNKKGWRQTTLKEVAKGKLSYGSGASAVEYDGIMRYIRITDITDNGELTDDAISPSVVDEKYLLHDGDILFARSGATVGKTFLYHSNDGRGIYAGYLIRFIPNQDIVLPQYVFNFTKTDYYASFIRDCQRAVAQPNINAQEYGNMIICIPPIVLQRQFARFVEQTDKSKFIIRQSLNQLEVLKKSLMQKYFE